MPLPISPEHRREFMRLSAQTGKTYAALEEEFGDILVQLFLDGAEQHVHGCAMNILKQRYPHTPKMPGCEGPTAWSLDDSYHFPR